VSARKVLRRIYGPVHDNEAWKSKCKDELYTLFKEPTLTAVIKIARFRWISHVQCMREDQTPKRLLNVKPSGRRNVGRPRARLDGVNKDGRKIGIRRW
jgi:hypothetical protein